MAERMTRSLTGDMLHDTLYQGHPLVLGTTLPAPEDDLAIEADMIADLLHQGFSPVIQGARIRGMLLLTGDFPTQSLTLRHCLLEEETCLDAVRLRGLWLQDCLLRDLLAPGLQVAEDIILDGSTFAVGLTLIDARIGGSLSCDDIALPATGAGLPSLLLDEARIEGEWRLRGVPVLAGDVSLRGTRIGMLRDDAASWEGVGGGIDLDGCRIGQISAESPLTLEERRPWLLRATRHPRRFDPAPWTEFAHLLRRRGNDAEARRVLIERQRQLIRLEQELILHRARIGLSPLRWPAAACALVDWTVRWIWAWIKCTVVGYGHAPQRALLVSLLIVLAGWLAWSIAWAGGVMTPTSDVILTSPEWAEAMARDHLRPSAIWGQSLVAVHYEEFQPFLYALDVYLPLLDLGQQQAWAATTASTEGRWFRALAVVMQLSGWAITTLGLAALTGLIQRDDD